MFRVLIVQSQVKRYRAPFFNRLHTVLRDDGIELSVVYSSPTGAEEQKGANADLRQQMSKVCCDRVCALFDLKKQTIRLEELYRQALLESACERRVKEMQTE